MMSRPRAVDVAVVPPPNAWCWPAGPHDSAQNGKSNGDGCGQRDGDERSYGQLTTTRCDRVGSDFDMRTRNLVHRRTRCSSHGTGSVQQATVHSVGKIRPPEQLGTADLRAKGDSYGGSLPTPVIGLPSGRCGYWRRLGRHYRNHCSIEARSRHPSAPRFVSQTRDSAVEIAPDGRTIGLSHRQEIGGQALVLRRSTDGSAVTVCNDKRRRHLRFSLQATRVATVTVMLTRRSCRCPPFEA